MNLNRLRTYANFVKVEHALFSLPMLFAGAFLANNRWPSLRLAFLMIMAGLGARTVALVMNRIIDREIDKLNPRTKDRPLATGFMGLFEAWAIAAFGMGIYLFSAWLISDFCFRLSWIPLIAFGAYPFMKRFTKWTHVFLGMIWSMVPVAGYVAVRPTWDIPTAVLILAAFSVFWLAGFDIIYSTLDEIFDRAQGLLSLPSSWGSQGALRASAFFHFLAFLALIVLYGFWFAGPITLILLIIIGLLLFLEHQYSNYVDIAFFHLNVAISFAVLGFVIAGTKGV